MSKVIANYTNEKMTGSHSGVNYVIQPGEKIKVHDKAANHLLTHLANRGLVALEYGDEAKEEEIKQAAIETNLEFKRRQIVQYNVLNENRKLSGQGYLYPSKTVKKYALELGIELLEPYSLKDVEKQAINEAGSKASEAEKRADKLEKELEEMKKAYTDIADKFNTFIENLSKDPEELAAEAEAYDKKKKSKK